MSNGLRSIAQDFDDANPVSAGRAAAANLGYSQFRRAYSAATEPKWQVESLSRITTLLRMHARWDSYESVPIRREAAMFALEILDRVMQPGTPSPAVVPSPDGGVQLEWHEKNVDLEIHVVEPYKGEIWWCDHSTGSEIAVEITPDLSVLRTPIDKLSVG